MFFIFGAFKSKTMRNNTIIFVLTILWSGIMNAQDTISFHNGDKMMGELKSLNKGVIIFETDYSDSDFKIEWKGIKQISTSTVYLMTLSDGTRLNGFIESGDSTGVTIVLDDSNEVKVDANEIVYLNSINDGFWSQLYANIDIGLNLTKAQNLKQVNMNAGVGYLGEKWSWDARYNSLFSTQDSISATQRKDGGLNVNFFLPKDWFVLAGVDFLSNTEQLLNLRLNGKAGAGYYLVHSNKMYWGITAGASYVSEDFSNGESNQESFEGFLGTELNMFDFGDFGLYTKLTVFPGITEVGRIRSDFKIDLTYDLPLDFYIKSGLTVNYDNQPTVGAGTFDYLFNTGFGWSW